MTPYIQGKALVLPRTNSKKTLIVRHTPGNRLKNEIACIKKIMKIINRKTSDCYRTVELDALTPASEPRCEILKIYLLHKIKISRRANSSLKFSRRD